MPETATLRVSRRFAAAAGVLAVLATLTPASGRPPKPPRASAATAGLAGTAVMQPVNAPARISRIALVPGTGGRDGWAIGHLRVRQPGWDVEASEGQLVFLRLSAGIWSIDGPPVNAAGRPVNPVLSSLAVAPGGETWAVGLGGTVVRHRPGGPWTTQNLCPSVTCADLIGVSLRREGGEVTGYAVGSASTVLTLSGGVWRRDDRTVVTSQPVDLVAVAAGAGSDAWAVTGSSSRSLEIYRRVATGWQRQLTGQLIFDGPHPHVEAGKTALAAFGTSVAVTRQGGVWVGGGLYPVDPVRPFGDQVAGDTQRPFTIFSDGSRFTTYCPVQYSLAVSETTTTPLCDRPMPITAFDVTSLSVLDGGDVFAGGLGLFHHSGDVWWHEPDAVGYLSSISFATPAEGWVASTGDTVGGGGTAHSSSVTVGHFTTRPAEPAMARWPQPNMQMLQSVAVSPGGARAIAVGTDGAAVVYKPDSGWGDKLLRRTAKALHAVAWSPSGGAWTIGEGGEILRYTDDSFEVDDEASRVTRQSLFALAYAGARGFAVGAGGEILVVENDRWRRDPDGARLTDETLYGIVAVGSGLLAVGSHATVLWNPTGAPGDWRLERTATSAAALPRVALPDLFAVSALADGSAILGGSRGTLLVRAVDGSYRVFPGPIDGSILALGATLRGGRHHIFASVAPGLVKYQADLVATTQGWLMYFDGERWRDLELAHRVPVGSSQTASAPRDPILAMTLDAGGLAGWAVGGTRDSLPDLEGHQQLIETSSIYRFDVEGNPFPPDQTFVPDVTEAGFRFAFFAETSCLRGLCGMTIGSGTTADEVARRIQEEINFLAAAGDGPSFALFGGNMRALGIPDELAPMEGYLSGFRIPFFAAMGARDVYSALSSGDLRPPPGLGSDIYRPPAQAQELAPANRFYLRQFARQAPPWGTDGAAERGFKPVAIGSDASEGLARTHYAFDYAPEGRSLARFIVLDTSDGTVSQTQTSTGQNPNEQQITWLDLVLADARTQNLATIILTNLPTVDPTEAVPRPMLPDGSTLEGRATTYGVSAVFTGGVRANATYSVPLNAQSGVRVPFFISGAGGAPLGGRVYPTDGFYHGWLLVTVDPTGVGLANPQAKVTVRTMPILESLALHALDGTYAPGGTGLRFEALARAIDGGAPWNDAEQARRTYMTLPLPDDCGDAGQAYGACIGDHVLKPDYRFVSDDPSIADFVVPAAGRPTEPLVRAGKLIADERSGYLCTFNAGTTTINVIAGTKRVRVPITVGSGNGPCATHPVVAPRRIVREIPPAPQPELAVRPNRTFVAGRPVVSELIGLPPPPPIPVTAPAPPAGTAGARKEEREASHEEAGHEGRHGFTALHARDRIPDAPAVALALSAGALAAAMLAGGIVVRRREVQARPVRVRSGWGEP